MTRKKKKHAKKGDWTDKYLCKTDGGATIDNKKNTPVQTTYQKPICHKGNTPIYQYPDGGTLYIGGWTNGATFDWNTYVIDLTGQEHKFWDIPMAYDDTSKKFLPWLMQAYAGWLSLPFPDYGTPKGMSNKAQWVGITDTIRGILKDGKDVLVACHGGHGRSGLFVSIVGYLLNIADDPSWASPVEKVREIHCESAVETFAQEKFVYNILGLRITPQHVYDNDPYWYGRGGTSATSSMTNGIGTYNVGSTFYNCPICGTQSLYVGDYGMCMGCKQKYELLAPVREDLTLEDISQKGHVEHHCDDDKCMGIWKASKCGHVTHNMIIYEGYCEACYKQYEDEKTYAEKKLGLDDDVAEFQTVCALCGAECTSAERYGICYECASNLTTNNLVDDVHCTITDPYHFISHSHCEDEHMCVGIVRADVCMHVVHNREVEDGLCPDCLTRKVEVK